MPPGPDNGYQVASAGMILDCHEALTGRRLIATSGSAAAVAEALYRSPMVVLAHDVAADPVFFYANLTAQALFEMPWPMLVRLPSRYSAEPLARDERARLLDRVSQHGYIDDYSGIRVSSSGRRFRIGAATVWNLSGADGRLLGQAAAFSKWELLNTL
jgi:hypothetical protein